MSKIKKTKTPSTIWKPMAIVSFLFILIISVTGMKGCVTLTDLNGEQDININLINPFNTANKNAPTSTEIDNIIAEKIAEAPVGETPIFDPCVDSDVGADDPEFVEGGCTDLLQVAYFDYDIDATHIAEYTCVDTADPTLKSCYPVIQDCTQFDIPELGKTFVAKNGQCTEAIFNNPDDYCQFIFTGSEIWSPNEDIKGFVGDEATCDSVAPVVINSYWSESPDLGGVCCHLGDA
jgi:hypothetical protein